MLTNAWSLREQEQSKEKESPFIRQIPYLTNSWQASALRYGKWMSGAVNYRFPDFRLADQSKNAFVKHAVDLANKCVPLKISTAPLAV